MFSSPMGRVTLALAAAVAAVVLPACREGSPRDDGTVTLVFTHSKHPRYAFLGELIRRFEAEHPGVRVREEILPSASDEQHQFYVLNLPAGASDSDVFDMDIIWVPEFARAGWLLDLTPHIEESELRPLHQAALSADRLEGRLYAVPWFVDAGVLYYRKDLLEKYGFDPPATYPELLRQAQHILKEERDPRLTGLLWQGRQYEGLVCSALEFMRGNGGDILRDGKSVLRTRESLEALQFMSDLVRKQQVTPALVTTLNEEASRHIFQSGRAIFMRNWPYAWRLMQQPGSAVAGRFGLRPVPHFPGHSSVPTMGGFHLGVNSKSRHPKEAVEFVRFMIRKSSQREIVLRVGVLAASLEVYGDAEVRQAIPFLPDLLPALERARPRPVTPYYLMISQVLQPELSAVVAGIRPPHEAMRLADEQIERLMEAQ
jgi:multiple sugar transport system substrate-binding protein